MWIDEQSGDVKMARGKAGDSKIHCMYRSVSTPASGCGRPSPFFRTPLAVTALDESTLLAYCFWCLVGPRNAAEWNHR